MNTKEEERTRALQAWETGQPDALSLLCEVAPDAPDDIELHKAIGEAFLEQGDPDGAVGAFQRVVELAPEEQDNHAALAEALERDGRNEEACALFARLCKEDPQNPRFHIRYGVLAAARGAEDEALSAFSKALELNPQSVRAQLNTAHILRRRSLWVEAGDLCLDVMNAAPYDPEATRTLWGAIHEALQAGKDTDAIVLGRRWKEEFPRDTLADFALAVAGDAQVPLRAPAEAMARLYDAEASRYDRTLEMLGYRGTELMSQLVEQKGCFPVDRALDAGCGTGAGGRSLAADARIIVGVDVSEGMLEKAEAMKLYNQLEKADILSFLKSGSETWDLIFAADLACCFGALEAFVDTACAALSRGGVLVFSCEELAPDSGNWRLNISGRYAHTKAYVEQLVQKRGGEVSSHQHVRYEYGMPVRGLVAVVTA